MTFKLTVTIIAACVFSANALAQAAAPSDLRASNDLLELFTQVCMKNLGHPDGVQAWAASHTLASVQAPAAITAYVGAGEGGAVWAVPLNSGLFALAIRASTKACAVYAERADPRPVEAEIAHLVDALRQRGSGESQRSLHNSS